MHTLVYPGYFYKSFDWYPTKGESRIRIVNSPLSGICGFHRDIVRNAPRMIFDGRNWNDRFGQQKTGIRKCFAILVVLVFGFSESNASSIGIFSKVHRLRVEELTNKFLVQFLNFKAKSLRCFRSKIFLAIRYFFFANLFSKKNHRPKKVLAESLIDHC